MLLTLFGYLFTGTASTLVTPSASIMQAVPEEVQGPIDGNTQSGDLRSVSVLRDPTPASPANNQDGVENDTEEDADSDQVESIRSDEDTQGTGDDETGSEEDRIGGEDDKSGDGEYIPTEDREGTPASNVVTRCEFS